MCVTFLVATVMLTAFMAMILGMLMLMWLHRAETSGHAQGRARVTLIPRLKSGQSSVIKLINEVCQAIIEKFQEEKVSTL